MRSLLSLWAWTVTGAVILVGFVVELAAFLLTAPFDRRRLVAGRIFRWIGIVSASLNPMWRFGVHGGPHRLARRRTVCVSNHRSQSDPFLVSHLPWEMKWLAKASLFRIPVVGWAMRLAGDVPVGRSDPESRERALERCARWLELGVPVMMFPEGTRGTGGELLPFRDGAFRLAIATGADLLPLAVAGSETALPPHDWRFGVSRALVAVGEPISTAGLTLEDVPGLRDRARGAIEALLAEIEPLVGTHGAA